MSRKASTREQINPAHNPANPGTWAPEPGPTVITSEEDELDKVFSDFPQTEACIQLFRVNPQGGRPRWLEQISPANFSMAYVCEKFGGGLYQAKGNYKDGSTVRMPFEIEGEPITVKRQIPQGNPFAPLPASVPQIVERSIDTENPMQGIQQLLLALLQKLDSQSNGQANSRLAWLEEIKATREILMPAVRETPIEQAIGMLTKGMELGQMQGGGEGGNMWLMLAKELKEPLMEIAKTVQAAIVQPKPRTVNPPGLPGQPGALAQPTATAPAQATEAAGEQSEAPMIGIVRGLLPMLLKGADKQTPPENYIDPVLDAFPDEAYPQLQSFLTEEGCLDKLAFLEPGILYHKTWFKNLRVVLVQALAEELSSDADGSLQSEPSKLPATGPSADSEKST